MDNLDRYPLLVDSRVGSVDLVPYLKIPAEVTQLRFADVSFMGNGPENQIWSIGIERKRIRDLIQSMDSGRLSGHQLIGLLDFYQIVYILVEGVYRLRDGEMQVPGPKKGMWVTVRTFDKQKSLAYREISNFLNTLAVVAGVNVWFTFNEIQSAEWIRSVYYWWQKPWDAHKSHLRFNTSHTMPKHAQFIKPTLVQRMVKELAGVGWDRALGLEKAFPTLEDLMKAKYADFIKVPGIGAKLAKSIYEELHRK